ncbi:hydratase [Bosea sp. (in: a-proteobacteria)]|uniref:hydratase n=1 Tax=Bosea sp. (in: a-proteobacteria) TaxID=1871050 RepID=UPI00261C318B|nr:hydratase [Bosea sp. (in: a-proteobacteria)]MCO5092806.1 hydratase [Bosea sp. (in: a-proteobacteria)]
MPTTVETLRDALVKARRERSLAGIAPLPVPETLTEGHAVQAAVGAALGLAEAGWKVAIAADGTPVAGLMPGPWLEPADVYEGAAGAELRIEIEIGLRLSRDVPLRPGRPWSRAEFIACCDKAFLGIEIIESRLADWSGKVAFPLWLADAMGHGGYLVGPEIDIAALDDPSRLGCFISLNGETLYDRPAVHGNGDPMVPVLAWANRAGDDLGSLRAGQIVTTGSLCGGVLAPGKGEVVARLSPLAAVTLTLR